MSKLPVISRGIAGTVVIIQQIVRTDGSIAQLSIEEYTGAGFMFIVNGCTNYLAYPTSRRAISAAAKTTC